MTGNRRAQISSNDIRAKEPYYAQKSPTKHKRAVQTSSGSTGVGQAGIGEEADPRVEGTRMSGVEQPRRHPREHRLDASEFARCRVPAWSGGWGRVGGKERKGRREGD